jgi:hypothetical protein
MQEETPPLEPALDGNTVAEIILESFASALIDWWYLWLAMLAVIVALARLQGWSRRVEARRRAERRERARIERAEQRARRP